MNVPAMRLGAMVMALALVLAGCGGGGGHRSAPTTRPSPLSIPAPVSRDVWNPPDVGGPRSAGTFCRGLIADFRHAQGNAIATTQQVKAQILDDFVAFTPKVIAVAPDEIAGPAASYLGALVKVVQVLVTAGFDASKAPPGSLGSLLVDPQVRAAGVSLAAWSQQHCGFDITSDGP